MLQLKNMFKIIQSKWDQLEDPEQEFSQFVE
jgi:hypothetical protein